VPMNVVALSVSQGSCLLEDSRRPGQLLTIPVYGVDEAQLRCSLGALAAGATATVTISVETGGEVGRLALNAAQVLSDTPDPDLTNNVTLLLVPEPQILGDVNDDGLVDFDDRDAVFNCADDSSGDECDDADVNGDGTVDPKDAAIVTQRRTASVSVNAATATFVKGDTETLNALEEYYEYYKLYLRSSSELPFNKFLALSIFGPLESVQMYNGNPPAQNGVSGGDYKIYTDIPDGELVGVSGCETCIGMIVLRPDVDPLVVHFNGRDDVDDTLDDLGPFPAGTRVAICGGNNSEGSNITLIQVTRFLLDNPQIEVEGYSNTIGLWIDNTGTFFLTNRDAPSNNVP
jgi:hypothetical protein